MSQAKQPIVAKQLNKAETRQNAQIQQAPEMLSMWGQNQILLNATKIAQLQRSLGNKTLRLIETTSLKTQHIANAHNKFSSVRSNEASGQATSDSHKLTRMSPIGEDRLFRKIIIRNHTNTGSPNEWNDMSARHRQRFISSRRFGRNARLAARIIEDIESATDLFRFDDESELQTEIKKRVASSSKMQESQAAVDGEKAFGYPFTEPSLYWGPRVNYAARNYWLPKVVDNYSTRGDESKRKEIRLLPRNQRHTKYGDPSGLYNWSLSPLGEADPYTAIERLFEPQVPHKRTLIHCDYLVSLVHFQSLAQTVGKTEFNRRLKAYGTKKIILRWNAFSDLQIDTDLAKPGIQRGIGSLQVSHPSSPDDLVIGDHVYFWNHQAYDLINEKIGNAWRLENAILIDRRQGNDIFLGHGSGRKTREQMLTKLASEYNKVARQAIQIVNSIESNSANKSILTSTLIRQFPNIKNVNGAWRIQGECFSRVIDMPLREIQPEEVLGLKSPFNPSEMFEVKRPSESQ